MKNSSSKRRNNSIQDVQLCKRISKPKLPSYSHPPPQKAVPTHPFAVCLAVHVGFCLAELPVTQDKDVYEGKYSKKGDTLQGSKLQGTCSEIISKLSRYFFIFFFFLTHFKYSASVASTTLLGGLRLRFRFLLSRQATSGVSFLARELSTFT
jgi:hypothetical protein